MPCFRSTIEAKFIGFSMYTTCVIWLAFAAVYFAIDVKVFSLCVATNASAYVVLIFLFFPKLYLIIFKPEKNQRRSFLWRFSFETSNDRTIFLVRLQRIRIFVATSVRQQRRKVTCPPIDSVKVHHSFENLCCIGFALAIPFVWKLNCPTPLPHRYVPTIYWAVVIVVHPVHSPLIQINGRIITIIVVYQTPV